MKALEKVIWCIENRFRQPVTLDELAQVAGISRYHLSRMFSYTVGMPISRYVRERRLSQAADELAAGKSDILDLALSIGYSSHEAFSRAFKTLFGQTPDSVRTQGHTRNLNLLEAAKMTHETSAFLAEPQLIERNTLLLAGLSRSHAAGNNAGIPNQWQAFAPYIGNIQGQHGTTTYGVVHNIDDDDNFDYLCAVEVNSFDGLHKKLTKLRLPESRYAVFQHDGHVSDVQETCKSIWSEWLPASGHKPSDEPFFERYGDSFNPATGDGGLQIWLPLE